MRSRSEAAQARAVLAEDLRAAFGRSEPRSMLAGVLASPEFEIVYRFRLASFPAIKPLAIYYRWRFRRLRYLRAVTLSHRTIIGPGFRIGHLGALVIHHQAVLGSDVTVCQGVTVGKIHAGSKAGVPTIGSHVYLAPNSVIIGGVSIGSHVVVAPNAFVNFSVPDHSIVIGNPGVVHPKQNPTFGMSNLGRADADPID